MKPPKIFICIAALAILSTSNNFAATLFEGKTVGYQYLFPDTGTVYYETSFTVGAGVELSGIVNSYYATMDVSDTTIDIDYYISSTYWSVSNFNGFRIYDINDSLPEFTSVTINPSTNMVGFSVDNITFDANNIWVNWQGLSFNTNTVVSLEVGTVPEPSTTLLFSSGAAFALLHRRRK